MFENAPKAHFHLMAKPSSFQCNIKCEYCFYLEKAHTIEQDVRFMNEDTLRNYVRNYIQSSAGQRVEFAWQGGEPTLLGLDFFKQAVKFQQEFANGKTITNAFQTNGIALNRQWAEFFKTHQFLIGISIDGLSEVHNKYRISVNGQPTFERVKRAVDLLKDYGVEFNTLTVINEQNWHKGRETYLALKELGSTFMQFIPIVETGCGTTPFAKKDAKPTAFSVPPQGYGHFLLEVFKEWVQQDVGKIYVLEFDNLLGQWLGYPSSSCVHQESCGTSLIVEANGDVYSCDHFVYPTYKVGNLNEQPLGEIVHSQPQYQFGQQKRTALTQACLACDVRTFCHGGCPKHRIISLPNEANKHNYLCQSYQLFFRKTAPFMRKMRDIIRSGGSAGDIVNFIGDKDANKNI
ncbi:anaerobic sulfatase maturase [Glaesserella parasuis]|uniref:anaerobic sulfatase maturase n=1 Tax=Glaesserella parasuis TaxID=738 RepID=UPI00243670DB|nr:anaerobic sulfatase maturase [Glaesserella parasuis]MDG6273501.1 anaerobic sulfatase maturase [Glaesserella parasuis]MDG6277660.1 anaerobic sulfatase maturase [Glaesserella parasuis]MDG6298543.1 anaerobic sulfatase maturase [Glaesserella parasuis]MDG6316565.1 anaerobic sulfatase maturase [Glaesserella parasuis]MDG6320205.1 anaerobic sulfatase maturase [Glaesserella parasuis]